MWTLLLSLSLQRKVGEKSPFAQYSKWQRRIHLMNPVCCPGPMALDRKKTPKNDIIHICSKKKKISQGYVFSKALMLITLKSFCQLSPSYLAAFLSASLFVWRTNQLVTRFQSTSNFMSQQNFFSNFCSNHYLGSVYLRVQHNCGFPAFLCRNVLEIEMYECIYNVIYNRIFIVLGHALWDCM